MTLKQAENQEDHTLSAMEAPVEIPRPANGTEAEELELKIDNFESLASYNWLDEKEPSVLVPGRQSKCFI